MDSEEWPSARSGHVSVAIGKFVLVWGGYSAPQNPEQDLEIYLPPREIWLYNSETFKWFRQISRGHHPPGLSGAQAVYVPNNKMVYILCGFMGTGHQNEVYRLGLSTWSWSHVEINDNLAKPSPRDKFGAWEFENSIYVFGGYGSDFVQYMHDSGSYFEDFNSVTSQLKGWNNQLLVFDTKSNVWSNPKCSGCIPSPRAAHGMVRVGCDVYLFGGRHDNLRLNDLYSLSLLDLQWTEIKTSGVVPVGRSWHTFSPLSDARICLFGGYTTTRETLGDLWYLDTVSLRWQQIHLKNSMPRLWHTASNTCNDDVIIFGGCSNDILSNTSTVHTCDLIVIRICPKTLVRLCLDIIYAYKDLLEEQWSELPQPLSHILNERTDSRFIHQLH